MVLLALCRSGQSSSTALGVIELDVQQLLEDLEVLDLLDGGLEVLLDVVSLSLQVLDLLLVLVQICLEPVLVALVSTVELLGSLLVEQLIVEHLVLRLQHLHLVLEDGHLRVVFVDTLLDAPVRGQGVVKLGLHSRDGVIVLFLLDLVSFLELGQLYLVLLELVHQRHQH